MLREEAVAVLPREQFVPTTCDSCFKPLPGAPGPVAPVCRVNTLLYKLLGVLASLQQPLFVYRDRCCDLATSLFVPHAGGIGPCRL